MTYPPNNPPRNPSAAQPQPAPPNSYPVAPPPYGNPQGGYLVPPQPAYPLQPGYGSAQYGGAVMLDCSYNKMGFILAITGPHVRVNGYGQDCTWGKTPIALPPGCTHD